MTDALTFPCERCSTRRGSSLSTTKEMAALNAALCMIISATDLKSRPQRTPCLLFQLFTSLPCL